MDEDQWYGLAKSQQSAAWKDGYDTARTACLAILADLRAQVQALADEVEDNRKYASVRINAYQAVLNLIDGKPENNE